MQFLSVGVNRSVDVEMFEFFCANYVHLITNSMTMSEMFKTGYSFWANLTNFHISVSEMQSAMMLSALKMWYQIFVADSLCERGCFHQSLRL